MPKRRAKMRKRDGAFPRETPSWRQQMMARSTSAVKAPLLRKRFLLGSAIALPVLGDLLPQPCERTRVLLLPDRELLLHLLPQRAELLLRVRLVPLESLSKAPDSPRRSGRCRRTAAASALGTSVHLLLELLDTAAQREQLIVLSRSTLRPRGDLRLEHLDALPRLAELGHGTRAARLRFAHLGPRAPMLLDSSHLSLSLRSGGGGRLLRREHGGRRRLLRREHGLLRQPRLALRRPQLAAKLGILELHTHQLLFQRNTRAALLALVLETQLRSVGTQLLGHVP
eukprot:2884716-Prymnesium_polylepis.1